ncbi:MAG: hypothetical protein ACKPKO_08000, partial [Candidatus Fonsibacter sp.]
HMIVQYTMSDTDDATRDEWRRYATRDEGHSQFALHALNTPSGPHQVPLVWPFMPTRYMRWLGYPCSTGYSYRMLDSVVVRLPLDLLVASSLSLSASAVLFFVGVVLALVFGSKLSPSVLLLLNSAHKGLDQVGVVPLVSSL